MVYIGISIGGLHIKVRIAIIPAEGSGTRVLSATKAYHKEMLPIGDKTTLLYIIEEAVESGIEIILIITSRNKNLSTITLISRQSLN